MIRFRINSLLYGKDESISSYLQGTSGIQFVSILRNFGMRMDTYLTLTFRKHSHRDNSKFHEHNPLKNHKELHEEVRNYSFEL